jgi:hypothetical protein
MSLIFVYQQKYSMVLKSVKINSMFSNINYEQFIDISGSFPYENYQVLNKNYQSKNLKIYGSSLSSLLPNGNKFDLEEMCYNKLIFISQERIKLIKTLFKEKYQKQLEFEEINKDFVLWEVKCTK